MYSATATVPSLPLPRFMCMYSMRAYVYVCWIEYIHRFRIQNHWTYIYIRIMSYNVLLLWQRHTFTYVNLCVYAVQPPQWNVQRKRISRCWCVYQQVFFLHFFPFMYMCTSVTEVKRKKRNENEQKKKNLLWIQQIEGKNTASDGWPKSVGEWKRI